VKKVEGNWTEFDLGKTTFALFVKEKEDVKPQKTRIMFKGENIQEMQQ